MVSSMIRYQTTLPLPVHLHSPAEEKPSSPLSLLDLPRSCRQIKMEDPAAEDGEYTLQVYMNAEITLIIE